MATLFATGWITATSGFVSGIVKDPNSADVVATLLTVNRLVRIDPAGNLTDLIPPGTITSMNSVDVDLNGDFVVGASGGTVYRVPSAGGSATLIATATGQGSSASGVAVVGMGMAPPPMLAITAPMDFSLTIDVTNLPAGTFSGFTALSTSVGLPAGTGPVFGIVPDAFTLALVTLFPAPSIGHPIHWLTGFPGFHPDVPFVFGPGSVASLTGTTFDGVTIFFDAGLQILDASNVVRFTIP